MPNVRYYIFLLGMLFLAPACREKTAGDFEIWGLDVSRHQQNVNWEKVIESEKPYFVLIKATEGTLIVAVRSGNVMATSFHPEVGGDDRIHGLFVDMVSRA